MSRKRKINIDSNELVENKKMIDSNVAVNPVAEENPDLDNETPLYAIYDLKKRSLYKVNGKFYLRIETGYPIGECTGDGDLDDYDYWEPLTKEEAICFFRYMWGPGPNHRDEINQMIGEKVDHIKVSKKAMKEIDRLWNDG